jgi:3-phosphoglycerate kinase
MMENNLCMDAVAFEKLNRKISILDIDISDQEVVLRADLDVPLTPFVHFKPIEEEFKELIEQLQEEATQDAAKQKKVKKTKKQLEDEAEQMARYEQAKKMRSEPWKTRQILDHKLLKRTEVSLKYLQEKLAKRIIVLSSIGEMCGRTEL